MVGTSPEEHHANAANILFELGHYRRCITQCNKYLGYSESDQVQAMLAYCHSVYQEWEQAALAYRSISTLWSDPRFALGLAEVEFRSGNLAEARKIVATIEASHDRLPSDVEASIEYLNSEFGRSSNVVQGN